MARTRIVSESGKEAVLYEKLKGDTLKCLACKHYCAIPEGRVGICSTRGNEGGKLYSYVYGRPAAVNMDPVEKKPLFHHNPGTMLFSIGTYGCNFRCSFCFTEDATIINDDSIKSLHEVFETCDEKMANAHGEIAIAGDRKTVTASGERETVAKVFRHNYEGDILTIKPRHVPPVTCTPEHRFFVWREGRFENVPAYTLKKGDYLAVPKLKPKNRKVVLDCCGILAKGVSKIKKGRKLDEAGLRRLIGLNKAGKTSREIGAMLCMHPVYLRKLLGKLKRDGIGESTFVYENKVVRSGKRVRFKMEKGDGIPALIPLDEDLAELLGYYCAEGHTAACQNRPSSFNVVFSYGRHEGNLARRTAGLLEQIFQAKPKMVMRRTALSVEVSKSSIGILFKSLCGERAKNKKVPSEVARSGQRVIKSFMDAYLAGDGCVLKDKIAFNTVSKKLALGIYHLLLLLGYLPSFYEWQPPAKKRIEGRTVNQSTLYYVKLTAEKFREHFLGNTEYEPRKKSERSLMFRETDTHWLVPVFTTQRKKYAGLVYNCEVDNEHSYLANFIAVCNCQNWEMSQFPKQEAGKEADNARNLIQQKSNTLPPEMAVKLALQYKADGIAYTYNEPAIWAEYAEDIAKLAASEGLSNAFISSGYESEEALDYLKHIDTYKIDLKGFTEDFYARNCGTKLSNVLDTIKSVYKRGKHLEIVTLVIPGENDSDEQLNGMAEFIAGIDKNIPWHVTQFHPDYKMADKPVTPVETLIKARNIGKKAGLRYIYIGNAYVPGGEDTHCPKCNALLVGRDSFNVNFFDVTPEGKCPKCGEKIYGVWHKAIVYPY
jgi:pyruvate formate lyase activating enzyme